MRLLALFLTLSSLVREELRDHAFGDCEVYIMLNGEEVGCGYFGGGIAELHIFEVMLKGEQARFFRDKITIGEVGRNDETGPDNFSVGVTLPGLTLEGVRQELTS